jgi:hypothetical protein
MPPPTRKNRARGSYVASYRQPHADETSETGHQTAGDEGQRSERPRFGEGQGFGAVASLHRDRGDEHDDGERDENEPDRAELPPQIGERTFLDRFGDLDHLRRALICGEHAAHQDEPHGESEQRGERRADEDEPFTAPQREVLVPAFGSDDAARC